MSDATPPLEELEAAAAVVYRHMQASPQLNWPLLSARCGCDVWVKHENHNPTGAFKVRGGIVYLEHLREREPDIQGIITATRGNHGQSIAFAAARHGLQSVVVVPEGNNPDKNRAMQALGAELVVHGRDFDEAVPHARALAVQRGLHRLPSFHRDLVAGVASYSLELLRARPGLQRVYVPVGLGTGICGMVSARNALGHGVEIVGVVAVGADAYARSFAAGECVATDTAATLADGVAVRVPNAEALDIMLGNVERIVAVSDEDILAAMAILFHDTHNVAEGAAAAPLAALLNERELNAGAEVAVVVSGGNLDAELYSRALLASVGR
ncbi:MAG: threonine dehydratase [Halioglobus sp.]|nr:threonine dehydratase [Halioglobus sp.]